MAFKTAEIALALLLIALYATAVSASITSNRLSSTVEDSERDKLPVGLALLPIRDPLLSNPSRATNDGTRIAIADSNVIVMGTKTADIVRTIEDVVSRDQSHDDAALTDAIVGIMGVDAPDAALKQKIRAALALRADPADKNSAAFRAFHDRITAIVTALSAAPRSDSRDEQPTTTKDLTASPSTAADKRATQADARLQPLVDVLGAVNTLL